MPASRRFRLSALLAGAAVVAASLLPAFPAVAEEPPTPDPVVTAEPTPDPTPTAEPTPEATPTPEPTPEVTAEPTPDPTPTPEPSPTPDANSLQFAGTFNAIANETGGDISDLRLFQVTGMGFLSVDVSGYVPSTLFGTQVITVEAPSGVTLSSDPATRFAQVAKASIKNPLTLLSHRVGLLLEKPTAALVSQTPNAAAEHRIYAVLVSPNSKPKASNQTAAKVATSVAHADDFWGEQSGGTIGFQLAGTVPWYSSSYSCNTESGSVSLWNQAATIAKSKLGYTPGKNNHLVLFFPQSITCTMGSGLGSVGASANEGGLAWVVGTDSNEAQASLAHELGHNMSLGHADWVLCSSATPNPGFLGLTGCAKNEYGDAIDIMGFATIGKDGGALSAPQAIRAGIWPSTAFTTATAGTTSFTLTTVASNANPLGQWRSVVVQDDNGVNYFIEYRNLDDEDSQYSGGTCTGSTPYCVSSTGGVRILRLENVGYKYPVDAPNGFMGFPGEDSYLMSRTVATVPQPILANGDIWWSKGASGIKVTVTGISGSTATVQVIKPVQAPVTDPLLLIQPTSTYDDQLRVGDTWTAFVGGTEVSDNPTFQWYRVTAGNIATAIPGAIGSSYTLTSQDLGLFVRVSLKYGGSIVKTDPSNTVGYGPIVTGKYLVDQPGSVSIDNSATPLVATPASWPVGTTYAYQWYRGSTATTATTAISGSGANTAFYTPTSGDYGKYLRVKVTATVPGYSPVSRYSTAKNYSLIRSGSASIAGTLKVGTQLSVDTSGLSYSTFSGAVVPDSFAYQWLRNGTAIAGSDASDDNDYTLQGADYGQSISLRVTAVKAGWVSNVYKTGSKTITTKGTFVPQNPVLTTASGLTRTAQSSLSDVVPPATSMTYQWYRNGVAITGKTAASYKLTSSDYGKVVTVKVKYYKSNYSTFTIAESLGTTGKYSLQAVPAKPVIHVGGTSFPALGGLLSVDPRTYFDMTDGSSVAAVDTVPTYQWYRSGTAISTLQGGKNATYTLTSLDKGKTITVKVTVTPTILTNLLPTVATSSATKSIGTAMIPGWDDVWNAPLTVDPTSTDFMLKLVAPTAAAMGLDPTGLALTYQWYRGDTVAGTGTAIANKTSPTYTLTQSDRDFDIWVRVTISKAAVGSTTYTTLVKNSAAQNPSLTAQLTGIDIVTVLGGTYEVGAEIEVEPVSYVDSSNAPVASVVETRQWYRNGTAISVAEGGTGDTYLLKPADAGKVISVKVTAGLLNYLPQTFTITAAGTTPLGTLVGPTATAPTVSVSDPATNTLLVTPFGTITGSVEAGEPPATFSYQWLRDGSVIPNQTAATYKLTSADWGKLISARVTAKLTGYTSVVLPDSDGIDYSIHTVNGSEPYVSSQSWALGETPSVYGLNFQTKDGTIGSPTIAYQWLRAGTPISGATSSNYELQPADVGELVTVRLTVTEPGYVTLVYIPNGVVVIEGTTTTFPDVAVVPGAGLGTLTADITGLVPATPAPVYTYKWFRSGTASPISTASTYTLVSADAGHTIALQVTMTRVGFDQVTTVLPGPLPTDTTTPVDYTILSTGVPTISGTAAVGLPLSVDDSPVTFFEADGNTPLVDSPTLTYKWYRNGTLISGQSAATYTLVAADLGTKITVKTVAALPGRVSRTTSASLATATVVTGTIVPGSYHPVVTMTNTSLRTMKVTFAGTPTVPAAGGFTATYKWYREGSSTAISTSSSYNLASADTGKAITVVVKISKSGYHTYTFTAVLANGITQGEAAVITGGFNVTDVLSCVAPIYYVMSGDALDPGAHSYQWYREATPIPAETGYNYTVTASDQNANLYCEVTVNAPYHDTLVEKTAAHFIP